MEGQRRARRLLLPGLLSVYLLLHLATLTDYGLTWDANELYVGDCNLLFFATLETAYLDYATDPGIQLYRQPGHPDLYAITMRQFRNASGTKAWEIWPVGCTVAAAGKWIFHAWLGWLNPIDASHAPNLLFGAALLIAVFAFARRAWGDWAAALAVVALFAQPRLWAHLHNNFKDVPSVLFFTLTVATFCAGAVERRSRWLFASAVCWGLGMATKANALLLPFILVPWFALVLWQRRRRREPLTSRTEGMVLVAYPFIGLAAMAICWPYLWLSFPEHLLAYVGSLGQRGMGGESAGWQTIPLINAVATLPFSVLLMAAAGGGYLALQTWRSRRVEPLLLLLVLWIAVPVGRVVLPGAKDFDVVRHWLEYTVPVALLAGLGGQLAVGWLGRLVDRRWPLASANALVAARAVAAVLWFTPLLVWLTANHPHQLAYYNRLVGRLPGAQARGLPQATDYWGSSYRQGIDWLNRHAEGGALIATGVAEHLVVYSNEVLMRPDLRLMLNVFNLDRPAADVRREAMLYPGSVYLMTITREDAYPPIVRDLNANGPPPVHTIRIDGAPILQIYRLK